MDNKWDRSLKLITILPALDTCRITTGAYCGPGNTCIFPVAPLGTPCGKQGCFHAQCDGSSGDASACRVSCRCMIFVGES